MVLTSDLGSPDQNYALCDQNKTLAKQIPHKTQLYCDKNRHKITKNGRNGRVSKT